MIAALFTTVAPVFISAGIGFAWARLGEPYDAEIVTRLVSFIGAPCLIFSTLVGVEGITREIGEIALAAVVALTCFAAIAAIVLSLARLSLRTYLASITFPNAGNMGLPLCLFAFGEQGLALGIGFFAVSATLQLTLGNWLYSGSISPLPALKAPIPYAVALGVILMVMDVEPPAFIYNTTKLLGGLTIPLMVITLGVSLGRMRVIRFSRTLALSLFRLGMGVAGGFALAEVFGYEGMQRGVLIIQCAMPVAVFNYLFAQFYERQPEEVASLVVLSSAIAFGFLPLLIYVAV
jgi:predicted permease